MDPIFEAYESQMFAEVVSRYTQVKNSPDKPIGKVIASIAKLTGTKAKGVFYKDTAISKLNLSKEYQILQKEIGPGNIGVAIIRDPDTNLFQTITVLGGSKTYNASGYLNKAKDFKEIEASLKEFEKSLRPKPSAADVNKDSAKFRSGRL